IPQAAKTVAVSYEKEIGYRMRVLSIAKDLDIQARRDLLDEISELREQMDTRIAEAIRGAENTKTAADAPTPAPAANAVSAKEAARQAAKAAYAQSITKVQLKTDIEAQAWRQPWERADEGTTPGGVKIFNKVERDELRKTEAFKKR